MDTTVINAIIAAIAGGFGVKALDIVLARVKNDQENLVDVRSMLRADVERLNKRIDDMQAQLDGWRDKFYALQAEHVALKIRYTALEEEYADLKRQFESLQSK